MDKATRNTLRNVVTQCRRKLEQAIGEMLQGRYGIHPSGEVEPSLRMTHLTPEEEQYRERVRVHLEHIKSAGLKPKDAVAQLVREAAFTHLNRLCAYKLMSQRGLMRDAVGKVLKSSGFFFYLADHPEDEALYNGGEQETAYRHFLEWLNAKLSEEIGVLFSSQDVASGLFPPHRVLESVLELLNNEDLKPIWAEDETIGWVYQYFTPKELRDQARKESAAPGNPYEMAFRNQFFTPRYVVEFLTNNTLGRTWYEMRGGDTELREKCHYLAIGGDGGEPAAMAVVTRRKKDPREIKVLDPACGSGHFLLYCFDLLQTIYEEAYTDAELGPKLQQDYPEAEDFKRAIPGLILAHNLHGIDIDLRVTQLAALALWLRAQRAFQEMGLKDSRPKIKRMHLVCAEPMPGEEELLNEFIAEELNPHPLGVLMGELVRNVFARMKLAGEAGALVRIEDDINEPLEEARKTWLETMRREQERGEELTRKGALFDYAKEEPQPKLVFDIADITSERVWHDAESKVVSALRDYVRRAGNGEGLRRRLFAEDAEQGFAFIDLCRQKFDVVLMNPPFGDASLPSKPYIDEVYGDTKGDVYKAFVECFQDRLVPGGFLGIISSRTGFFLSGSSDWRERIVLRLYRPLVLADFGMGVLDAMVETAAYVLRSLTKEEDRQLTLELAKEIEHVPPDKNDVFSTKKYEVTRGLKRHQANSELRRLNDAGFIKPVKGNFPRWTPLNGVIDKAPAPANALYPPLVCLRLLGEDDKGQALDKVLHKKQDSRRFVVVPEDFRQVPNTPFCYWVSDSIRRVFRQFPSFMNGERTAKKGISTADDFRFIRTWWEISPEHTLSGESTMMQMDFLQRTAGGKCWVPFAKGGAYSPYYADLHLVVNWGNNGDDLKKYSGAVVRNERFYFRSGLTWSDRTTRGITFRAFPAGAIFAAKGPVVFANNLSQWVALLQSSIYERLVSLQLGAADAAARSYEVGLIQHTPVPDSFGDKGSRLAELGFAAINLKRSLAIADELNHFFNLPVLLQGNGSTLAERAAAWQARAAEAEQQLAAYQHEIDDIAFRLYSISDEDRRAIETSITSQPSPEVNSEQVKVDDEAEDESASTDQRQLTADFISYAVGCAFGRWDVRYATGERPVPELPDPFAPLPVCAHGALTGEDGLPLLEAPEGYPLRVDSDGILIDDPTHVDDILSRVRKVFELIWPKAAEAHEL